MKVRGRPSRPRDGSFASSRIILGIAASTGIQRQNSHGRLTRIPIRNTTTASRSPRSDVRRLFIPSRIRVQVSRELDPRLRIRAWPLELINGKPLDPDHIEAEIVALRGSVRPDLFAGFTVGIQCSELLKFCLGAEVVTMDRCIAFDSVAMESDSRQYRPNPLCKWCGVEGSAPAASRYTNSPDPIEDRDGGTGSAATRTSWSLSELPEVLAVSPRSSGTLRLRLPRSSDAGALFGNLTSSTRVTRYLSWSPHERESQTLEFLDYLDSANRGGDERTWVIAEDIADEPIGLFSCWLDKPFSTEVGVCLGSGWWNRGIMTACLRTVIDTLRDVPAIYRVWATCDVDNVRSATVMERAGMHHEGLLTRHAIRPNLTDEPRDSLMYGMALR